MKKILAVFSVVMLLVLVSCAQQPATPRSGVTTPPIETTPTEPVVPVAPPATTVDVQILRTAFDPEMVTIKVGDTVSWKNTDDRIHGLGGDVISGRIEPGATFDETFDTAGTYEYIDTSFKFHGKVFVEEVATATE